MGLLRSPRLQHSVLAIAAGFVGGFASSLVAPSLYPDARSTVQPFTEAPQTRIAAAEFDLTDRNRTSRARLFIDDDGNPLLLFERPDRGETAFIGSGGFALKSSNGEVSIDEYSAKFSGKSGTVKLSTGPGPTQAFLVIGSGHQTAFISPNKLDVHDDDGTSAGLSLPDKHLFPNGGPALSLWQKDNEVDLRESGLTFFFKRDERARLSLDEGGDPSLSLFDQKNRTRAVLGVTDLRNSNSGSIEHRSPSSLVLFKDDGRVLWQAP